METVGLEERQRLAHGGHSARLAGRRESARERMGVFCVQEVARRADRGRLDAHCGGFAARREMRSNGSFSRSACACAARVVRGFGALSLLPRSCLRRTRAHAYPPPLLLLVWLVLVARRSRVARSLARPPSSAPPANSPLSDPPSSFLPHTLAKVSRPSSHGVLPQSPPVAKSGPGVRGVASPFVACTRVGFPVETAPRAGVGGPGILSMPPPPLPPREDRHLSACTRLRSSATGLIVDDPRVGSSCSSLVLSPPPPRRWPRRWSPDGLTQLSTRLWGARA